ncbi:nuclear transport factor 2 family protein [Streptomyces sp. NBC_00203]|uniref:nuclear transport factor 2 family protein n=1 Tax=Streptomyces sp. NBC_00203 TaxID=2975680 RepID=UPI0032445832
MSTHHPTSADDLMEIQQLLARYAVCITRGDIDGVLAVFTPDGTYSAFGDTYPLAEFPALVAAAPKGLFLTGTAAIDLAGDGNAASGSQPLCFIDHATHAMRIGYYSDSYVRTADGWRLRTRAMTFIRRSGAHDSGRPHAYERSGPGA